MKINPKTLQDLELRKTHQKSAKPQRALLAIDYGEKFCGLAFSPDGICVLPLKVVQHENLFQTIIQQAGEKNATQLIFGLPLSSDNYENKICQKIRKFAQKFDPSVYTIHFQNERFSSQQTLTPKKDERIDDLAAAKILEYFLEIQNK